MTDEVAKEHLEWCCFNDHDSLCCCGATNNELDCARWPPLHPEEEV